MYCLYFGFLFCAICAFYERLKKEKIMKIKRLASLLLCVLLTFSLLLSASADVVGPSSGYSLILDENWELGTGNFIENVFSYVLPSVTRPEKEFLGWSLDPNGAPLYGAGDKITLTADTTLYAVWGEIVPADNRYRAIFRYNEYVFEITDESTLRWEDFQRGAYDPRFGTFYLYQNSHLWYHLPSENPFPVSECMVLVGWRPDYDTSGQIFTYAVESFTVDDFIDHNQVITFTPVWEINHSDSDGNHFCDKCGDFLGSGYAVLSLGAKVNEKTSSLRLGAFYNGEILTSAERASVQDLGMLFYPSHLLGENTLDLSNTNAARMSATAIEEFNENKTFVDYETFTFYATIVNIPDKGKDTNISFRPYIIYGECTFYGDVLARSYNDVVNVNRGIALALGDNEISCPDNWFD